MSQVIMGANKISGKRSARCQISLLKGFWDWLLWLRMVFDGNRRKARFTDENKFCF